jgi:hypothetical protein
MLRTRLSITVAMTAIWMVSAPVRAHHSYAATYFEDRTETITGTVVQFLFRNPHSFLHVEVKDPRGNLVRYAVEWSAGLLLEKQGVTRETLKASDRVMVTGNPGRVAEDHRLRLRSVRRLADGWSWGEHHLD